MKISLRIVIQLFALVLISATCSINKGFAQPTWSKIFTPNTIGPGSVSTLTFTITNNTGGPVTDLAFTDVLPTVPGDVDIANPANVSTSCGVASIVTAPDGGGTISFSNGTLGNGESCTITVDVTAGTPGVHTNLSGDLTSDAGNSGTATDDLTVDASLPGFSKSFAPSSVSLGGRSTLTFLIDNSANGSNVLNLDFTDNLPTGMMIASPSNASTTCGTATIPPTLTAVEGTNTIVLDANGIGAFPALASGATCTVTVDVMATAGGDLDNISGDLLAEFISAGKASATLDVTVTPINLTKKFVDDPIPPGGTAELLFTIQNFDRDFTATDVSFSDDLDATLSGLTFSSVLSNTCGGTVTGLGTTDIDLMGGMVSPGAICSLRVSLSVPAGAAPGAYTNTTTAVEGDLDGEMMTGNMATDILHVEPVPILTKEFLEMGTLNPDPVVNPGDDVVLRFTVTNTSLTSSATDIEFFDELTDGSTGFPPDNTSGFLPFPVSVTLPPTPDPPCGAGSSLALVSRGTDRQALELTGGSLDPVGGGTSTCTFDVTITIPEDFTPGNYLNTTEEPTATVDGATRIGDPDSDYLTVIAAPSLTKSFIDDPVAPDGQVTLEFKLELSQNSPTAATDITFTDNLTTVLAGLVATGLPIAAACDPDGPGGDPGTGTLSASMGDALLTFMGGELEPGEECTFSVTLDVPDMAVPGSYTNTTSEVSATVEGTTATSAAASDILDIAGLDFTKEFLGDPVIAGDTRTLRFSIENTHPTQDATITFFTDNLQADLTGLAATGPPSVDECGGSLSGTTFLVYTGGSVMAGQTCNIEVEVLVPLGTADGTYNNITSNLSANQGGPVTIDPAFDQLVVNSNLIQLEKEFTDDPVAPGDPVTLEFRLTNLDGVNPATMIDFTDDLSAILPATPDLVFTTVDFDDCGGTVSGTGTNLITVMGASLSAGGACTIRVTTTVPAAAPEGTFTNTTSDVTGDIGGFAVTGDAASDDLEILQLLQFSKSFDGPTVAGGTAMLTFTITNPGINIASGIQFTDNLDAVISGLEATSLPSNPCGAGSTISGTSLLTFSGGELPPMGGTCSFDVEVTLPATATAGTFPNITSVLSQSGLKVGEPATADLEVEPPPLFSKVFTPDASFPGDVSTLIFTINNSASVLAASNLDFTDNLPTNVIIATPSNASTTCSGGTLTAPDGGTVITYTGGTVGASASCTVQVDVTSHETDAYINTTGDLTSSSGNSGTAMDTWNVQCDASYFSTISGTTSLCEGFSPDPEVTFTFSGGTAPYTFTYTINGGAPLMVTTTMGNSVTVSHPTSTPGVFTYELLSAVDDNNCPGAVSGSATAVITIFALPTATISGDNVVCEGDADPDITFTGADGTAPYTFTYTINGGAPLMVTTTMGNSVTVAQSTATPGTFTYELVSVADANMCSQAQMGTATITVNPLPTASISGTITVCEGDTDPDITFTGADGTAPYTFTYTINGGAPLMVTTAMGNSVTVAQSTTTPGTFTYELVSVEDANMCSQIQMGTATITVNPLPTASISGTMTVCEGDTDPDITFTGADGTAPYTFTYTINGGAPLMVTTAMGNSVTVAQSTATPGTFTYELVSVEDANMCSQIQMGTATITVNPLPTASISGTMTVCEGDTDPDITFTGADGTAPYTFTYTINGGAPQMVTTTMGNSVTVAQSTASPGTFTYELVSVADFNTCSQAQAGTAVITVSPQPGTPGAIKGPAITCPGLDNLPYEAVAATYALSYEWTFTDPAVIINGQGNRNITLDGVTIAGTLSVKAINGCGMSAESQFDISIATPEICVLADCTRNSAFIDDEILDINGMTDVFKVIELLESDATIQDTWFKIFRAGEGIVFYPPFTVENGATLIAEIESCFAKTVQFNQKR